jgi:hypothetical protein
LLGVDGLEEGYRDLQVRPGDKVKLMERENPKKNPIVQEYVLPTFSGQSGSTSGYIRSGPNAEPREPEQGRKVNTSEEEEAVLWMGNERFAGPELLFNPSDIGESSPSTRTCSDDRPESNGIGGYDSRDHL